MRRLTHSLLLLCGLIAVGVSVGATPASAACTAGSKNDAAKVQLWADKGCLGGTVSVGFTGDDDRPDFRSFLGRTGDVKNVNNDRSSIAVAGGWCAKFFDPLNYGDGDEGIFCAVGRTDYFDFGALNDRASSMRVCPEDNRGLCNRIPKDGTVPPPPPPPPPVDPCANGACDPPPDPCANGACDPGTDPCLEGLCDGGDPCLDGGCDGGEGAGAPLGPLDGLRFDRPGRRCRGSSTAGARALRTWLADESGIPQKRRGLIYRCGKKPARGKTRDLHAEGRAIDVVPTSEDAALDLITLLLADDFSLARRMGVQEIIYDGRVWSSARPTRQLRRYRGTAPHRKLVHVGLNKRGASMRTSFWADR
jgi:hypothetical protein